MSLTFINLVLVHVMWRGKCVEVPGFIIQNTGNTRTFL